MSGCIEDGTINRSGTPRSSSTSSTSTTSTTVSSSTTAPGDPPDGPTTTAAVVPDEIATDDTWWASPGQYRGQDGFRVAYTCPANGTLAPVWGTGPFTDDSSVCSAGVFAGVITLAGGGRVTVEIAPGADDYAAGEQHGVVAEDYGVWAGSFTVVG